MSDNFLSGSGSKTFKELPSHENVVYFNNFMNNKFYVKEATEETHSLNIHIKAMILVFSDCL